MVNLRAFFFQPSGSISSSSARHETCAGEWRAGNAVSSNRPSMASVLERVLICSATEMEGSCLAGARAYCVGYSLPRVHFTNRTVHGSHRLSTLWEHFIETAHDALQGTRTHAVNDIMSADLESVQTPKATLKVVVASYMPVCARAVRSSCTD